VRGTREGGVWWWLGVNKTKRRLGSVAAYGRIGSSARIFTTRIFPL
jgi:hypothetical protein